MVDQHQLYALIAKAICDIRKDDCERQMDLEEAKQIAKCVLEALAGAGFEIRLRGEALVSHAFPLIDAERSHAD